MQRLLHEVGTKEAIRLRGGKGVALFVVWHDLREPSHVQGADCLLHEGRPVGRGCEKWLLRSDVLARPGAA